MNRRQQLSAGEPADESRNAPAGDGGMAERPDLLRVALAAYAAHLENQRTRLAGAATPWGRSGRIANLRRFAR